jgi:hypothetical protein
VHGGSGSGSRLSRRTQVTERTAAAAAATASPPRRNQPAHPRGGERKTKTEQNSRAARATRVVRSSAFRHPVPHQTTVRTLPSSAATAPAQRRPDQTRARVLIPPPWERGGGGDEAQEPPLHRLRAQAVRSLPFPLLPPPLAQAQGRSPPRDIADEFLFSSRSVVRWLSHARDLGSVRRLAAGICFSFVLIFFPG